MALGWRKDYLRYKSYFLNILNLYKRKEDLRMFLEIILSLVTISFFGVFALRPTFLTISELLREIRSKEEIIVKMDVKIKNLQTAQNILNQESLRIPILDLAIPTQPQPQVLSHQLQGIASISQVKIIGVNIDETVIRGEVSEKTKKTNEKTGFPENANAMSFSASIGGSYQNLFLFLQNLEKLRNPIKIDVWGLSISRSEEGNELTLVISGKIPYLKEK